MKKLLATVLFVLLLFALRGYAQDISIANARILLVKDAATLLISVKNTDSSSLKNFAELNVDFTNDSANVIAQIQLQTNVLKAYEEQVFQVPLHAFKLTGSYTLKQVKKITIRCDPQNKIKETNEENNVYGLNTVSGLLLYTKKQKLQGTTQF